MGQGYSEIAAAGRLLYGRLADGSYDVVRINADGSLAAGDSIMGRTPLGYGQIAATAAVVELADVPTIAIPVGATMAIIEPAGAAVRYRDDGADPTTTAGMSVADGARQVFSGDLTAIRLIAKTGTAAYNVIFYG